MSANTDHITDNDIPASDEFANLQNYIAELAGILTHGKGIPAEQEQLKEAYKLSIQEQWRLDKIIESHLVRSEQALEQKQYLNAIVELERCWHLDPANIEFVVSLGNLYLKRFLNETHSSKDRLKAEGFSQLALSLSTGKNAAVLQLAQELKNWKRRKFFSKRNIIIIIILALLLCGILTLQLIANWSRIINFINILRAEEVEPFVRELSAQELLAQQVPVYWWPQDATSATGLRVKTLNSERLQAPEFIAYRLQANILVAEQTLEDLQLQVKYYSGTEASVKREAVIQVAGPRQAPLSPGDTAFIDEVLPLPFAFAANDKVEISIVNKLFSADADESQWQTTALSNRDINLELRDIKSIKTAERTVYILDFGVKNMTKDIIEDLALRVDWPAGNSVGKDLSGYIEVTNSSSNAFLPNMRVARRVILADTDTSSERDLKKEDYKINIESIGYASADN